ncbi:hypothetical protein PE067_21215 [Paracoccus sp. DMF-8]|uniref:hypothetical protein n=1 Tax=Paracoccus sp. DMF-8 TaxID=3019445 RepID=UPI0023E3C97C|nr:hypothetical protein [Paracoccus sp. DMF-8]MDF3608443.1 hypothetical protein [Paracoccus sp. DMF-8]
MILPRGLSLTLIVLGLLAFLVAGPLATILIDTLGSPAWGQVLWGRPGAQSGTGGLWAPP